jgi:Ca2+/Na+ antiporter
METNNQNKKEFTLKQKSFLYFYKSKQYLNYKWHLIKEKIKGSIDSFYFYLIVFGASVFLLHRALIWLNITISNDNLHGLAFAVAGIIGASIAIVFSFSTFILQSTADLFSTQYLNKFIQDVREKVFFWLLVFFTIAAFFTPIFLKTYVLEVLIAILFIALYLIYNLYKELRKRINPETTLTKIRNDAINQLTKVNKELKKHAHIQNKIFEYEKENKDFSLDVQYKANPNWNLVVLENVKYLFEIGLRLLSKNEINSFNLTVKYIRDIYLKHLALRNSHFIRIPASFWGTYTFDDEGFTAKILEYLQSIGDRIIQEKRKENIYYLLRIYENILVNSLNLKYADKTFGRHKGNPLLSLVTAYYTGFIEKLLAAKENDWTWESIKSVSNVSNSMLQKTDDYFISSQINQIINKISISCLGANQEAFCKEIVNIYFNQIKIAWNRYEHNEIFWGDLFKELKKSILLLSVASNRLSLSASELFINFHAWQGNVINWIIEIKEEKEKKEILDKFMQLLERWSDFLLDFARDIGLENKQIGLPIIQSIENNINIIYGIKSNFSVDVDKIYKTQFYTLSWYFQKTDKVEESFLFNLEQVLEILLKEISYNLKNHKFDIEYLIELYIRLIEQHFEKVTLGYGYNHPRVIEKLVYLGLFLHKYKRTKQENDIIAKIDELNKKYLKLNKEYFELKQKEKNLMGPDKFQLCKELHDLENDLFSYNNSHSMGVKYILKNEITKDEWNGFKGKLNYCKSIKYETRHIF